VTWTHDDDDDVLEASADRRGINADGVAIAEAMVKKAAATENSWW
jgi:hypothetical protein